MNKSAGKVPGAGRDAAKEQFWRRMIAEFDPQRTTMRQWCAARGLSEPSFYAWRRELARRDRAAVKRGPTRLLRVKIKPGRTTPAESDAPAAHVTIVLASGLRLQVNVDQLAAVLDALESRAC